MRPFSEPPGGIPLAAGPSHSTLKLHPQWQKHSPQDTEGGHPSREGTGGNGSKLPHAGIGRLREIKVFLYSVIPQKLIKE